MRLYLLRHGHAMPREEYRGEDAKRPLTESGVELLRAQAEAFRRMDLGVDVIITSPYTRAEQTAQIVADRLDLRSRLMRDERLAPGFQQQALSELLRENEMAHGIMLVGHEPDLSEMVSGLIGGGRVVMKKGALARVDLPEHSVRRGELVWLVPSTALAS